MLIHVVVALLRVSSNKSENIGLKTRIYREVVTRDIEESIGNIKNRIGHAEGLWRIYRTVNRRDLITARKQLMIKLIENPESKLEFIDTLWQSIMMKEVCRGERNFLIDIDTKNSDTIQNIRNIIKENSEVLEENCTPNGYHFITKKFDYRPLLEIGNVEVKKDALFFIEEYKGRGDK